MAMLERLHPTGGSVFASLLLLAGLCSSSFAAREPALSPVYDHWLHAEVNYLITDEERTLFLHLKTNEERDKFIDTFWQVRNPDRQAPTNPAKETHYQRLAYANAHYSRGGSEDGWASDQGMVYITLGAPQQIQRYTEIGELKPIQIWFYQNLEGALPVHFYVVFYKPSAAEEYELYSPYGDRPQKLINSSNAVNDDRAAIKIIQRDINDEAAHIALSLIPGEPVDLKNPTPTLQSDVLLNNIRNYRNLPQTRERLAARRLAEESVSHRVILGEQSSDLAVIATRDGAHRSSIHYLLRLLHPDEFAVSLQADGRSYYSLEVETKLTSPSGGLVYRHSQKLREFVDAAQLADLRGKCLAVEGRVPSPPGRYQFSLTLTNGAASQAFHQQREILVPSPGELPGAAGRIGLSQLYFAGAEPPASGSSPGDAFSFSGVRLQPVGADNAAVNQGDPLRAIFQVWAAPGKPAALHGKQLQIHYLVGRPGDPARQEQDQMLDMGTFSPEGNLLVGKDLRTDILTPGTYRLVVKVADPETHATAYQSVNFEVRDADHPVASLWRIDVPASSQ